MDPCSSWPEPFFEPGLAGKGVTKGRWWTVVPTGIESARESNASGHSRHGSESGADPGCPGVARDPPSPIGFHWSARLRADPSDSSFSLGVADISLPRLILRPKWNGGAVTAGTAAPGNTMPRPHLAACLDSAGGSCTRIRTYRSCARDCPNRREKARRNLSGPCLLILGSSTGELCSRIERGLRRGTTSAKLLGGLRV
jgi:hypothetical protein